MPKEHLLTSITKEASEKASEALLKLTHQQASIEFTKIEVGKVKTVFLKLDPESVVTGVYLPISGDTQGASLLIFPEKVSHLLCDMLMNREPGTTLKLNEYGKSALNEVGNIILGSILTVLSNNLKLKMIEHMPNFCQDMLGALVDQVIVQFIQKSEEVLIAELVFHFTGNEVKGYVLLIFETEEIKKLIEGL